MKGLFLCMLFAACGGSSHPGGGVHDGFVSFDGAITQGDGPDGGSGGPTLYCGLADSSECVCGNQPSDDLTEGQTCNGTSVGSPSLCCATSAYPNDDESFLHSGCYCSQIFCAVSEFGDTCICSFSQPESTDPPMTTCTGFGPVCCRTRSDIAPSCTCYTDISVCPDGDETVSGCGPEDVKCADQTLTSCN